MKILLVIFFCCSGYCAPNVFEDNREIVEPEHLSNLLKEKKYEEFSRLMLIDDPQLVMPRDESDKTDPRYNRNLEHGDFLMTPAQKNEFQGRNLINAYKHPSYRWPSSVIPYQVDTNGFNSAEVQFIHSAIQNCNIQWSGCITAVPREKAPRNLRTNYVHIINGNGCYSYIGCIGKQQVMSLQNAGCLSNATICHEFIHAMGFGHEHSREDRDSHITMKWENINSGWESQFDMMHYDDYVLYLCYDVCSVMHYPRFHPDLCKPGTFAFDIKVPDSANCTDEIGYARALSELDKQKVCKAYPKKA